jgi:DNA topoisomerase-3
METAGKQVDDEDLRELMKENGIGRPSTRANIIETLFKRQYIVRNKNRCYQRRLDSVDWYHSK